MKGHSSNQMICTMDDAAQKSALANHSIVTCSRCGATANDPANVCEPVQIP